jgi:hypothetical protein
MGQDNIFYDPLQQKPSPSRPREQTGGFRQTDGRHTEDIETSVVRLPLHNTSDDVTPRYFRAASPATAPGVPGDVSPDHLIAQVKGGAAEVRAAAMRSLCRFGEYVPDSVLFLGLCDPDRNVRIATLETIAELAYRVPVSLVQASLNDPDPLVRTMAAWCLGHFQDRIPVQRLLEIVSDQDEPDAVRAAALRALGETDDPRARRLLDKALDDQKRWQLREAAIQALSCRKKPLPWEESGKKLLSILHSDSNELVQVAAIEALIEFDDQIDSVVEVLQSLSNERDKDEFVREAATSAIEVLVCRWVQMLQHKTAAYEARLDALRHLARLNRLGDVPEQVLLRWLSVQDVILRKAIASTLSAAGERHFAPRVGLDLAKERYAGVLQSKRMMARKPKNIETSRGVVEFIPLLPQHLYTTAALLVMALDPYYMNRLVRHAFQRPTGDKPAGNRREQEGDLTYNDVAGYVERLIHREYIRALLNGRSIVIFHKAMDSNPVLSRDIMTAGDEREALKTLLHSGVIVPYLHKMQRPDEMPGKQAPPGTSDTFTAWQQICTEVSMACLRLVWSKDEHDIHNELENFYRSCHRRLELVDLSRFLAAYRSAEGNGSRPDETGKIEQNIDALRAMIKEVSKVTKPLSRKGMYKHFGLEENQKTEPSRTRSIYERMRPGTGVMKDLLDTVYYAALAQRLDCRLLASADALPLSAVEPYAPSQVEREPALLTKLIELARLPDLFAPIATGRYVQSLHMLSLVDVIEIRKSQVWESYISLVEIISSHFLAGAEQQIEQFVQYAPDLHRHYVQLMRMVTEMLAGRFLPGPHADFRAYWNPVAAFEIEVGGARAAIQWERQGPICKLSGALTPEGLTREGDGLYVLYFRIGECSNDQVAADLSQVFEVRRGWLANARSQWERFVENLKQVVQGRIRREESVSFAPVLYL